jgi:hypothetical protein
MISSPRPLISRRPSRATGCVPQSRAQARASDNCQTNHRSGADCRNRSCPRIPRVRRSEAPQPLLRTPRPLRVDMEPLADGVGQTIGAVELVRYGLCHERSLSAGRSVAIQPAVHRTRTVILIGLPPAGFGPSKKLASCGTCKGAARLESGTSVMFRRLKDITIKKNKERVRRRSTAVMPATEGR